jgi:hypothetical protein
VDQSAEKVAATDGSCGASVAVVGAAAVWRGELERAVGPVFVVVPRVDTKDTFEMAASEDENAIQAVAADGSHPALGVGVRVRRLHWRPDHVDPVGCTNPIVSWGAVPEFDRLRAR